MEAIGLKIYKKIHKPIDLLVLKSDKFLRKKNSATMEKKIARDGIKIYG
jgi:hypothetical protein